MKKIKFKIVAILLISLFLSSPLFGADLYFEKTFTVNERGKLAYIEAVDNNDNTRKSKDKLQMVSKKSLQSRSTKITAYKDDPTIDFKVGEPKWSGLINASGVEFVIYNGKSGGEQRAEADGLTRTVIIEIINGKEYQISIGENSFAKFKDILITIATVLGGDKEKVGANINGTWKWYKVDQRFSPLCQTTYEFSAYGSFSYGQKFYIPAYSINFPYVKIGIFVEPNLKITIKGIEIIRDGTLNPVNFSELKGGAGLEGSLSGGAGAEINDPWKVISVKADVKGTVAAGGEFTLGVPGPVLSGEVYLGRLTLSGEIKLEFKGDPFVSYEVSKEVWEGLTMPGEINFSQYFEGK